MLSLITASAVLAFVDMLPDTAVLLFATDHVTPAAMMIIESLCILPSCLKPLCGMWVDKTSYSKVSGWCTFLQGVLLAAMGYALSVSKNEKMFGLFLLTISVAENVVNTGMSGILLVSMKEDASNSLQTITMRWECVGAILGAVVSGILATYLQFSVVMYITAVCCVVGACIIYHLPHKTCEKGDTPFFARLAQQPLRCITIALVFIECLPTTGLVLMYFVRNSNGLQGWHFGLLQCCEFITRIYATHKHEPYTSPVSAVRVLQNFVFCSTLSKCAQLLIYNTDDLTMTMFILISTCCLSAYAVTHTMLTITEVFKEHSDEGTEASLVSAMGSSCNIARFFSMYVSAFLASCLDVKQNVHAEHGMMYHGICVALGILPYFSLKYIVVLDPSQDVVVPTATPI